MKKQIHTHISFWRFQDFSGYSWTFSKDFDTVHQTGHMHCYFHIISCWAPPKKGVSQVRWKPDRSTNVSDYFKTMISNKIKQICTLQVRNAFPSNEKKWKAKHPTEKYLNYSEETATKVFEEPASQRNRLIALSNHTQALLLFHLWNLQSCLQPLFPCSLLSHPNTILGYSC